jgi:hypothetical protein
MWGSHIFHQPTESACQLFLLCSTPLPVVGKAFLKLHNLFHSSCGIFAVFDDTKDNNDFYCISALANNGQKFSELGKLCQENN